MGKEDIIDYVMKTPENTNPNILRSLLDSEANNNKYIVTLTPTAQDFSGTMDKTVAEINEAYEAGQEIVFKIYPSATAYYEIGCTDVYYDQSFEYPRYCADFVQLQENVIIKISTPLGDDGTLQAYDTKVYSLTRAS